MTNHTDSRPHLTPLRRIAVIWVALLACAALSIGSSIAILPALDRWNDCGREASEFDLAAAASPMLAAAAIVAWFWLRHSIPTTRPELLGLASAAIVAILLIVVALLQLFGAASWDESVQSFREACGISEWIAFVHGMSLHLPVLSIVVLTIATPRSRPVSRLRAITSAALIVALWVSYVVAARPFVTFMPA
ncbi:hypothetical protein CLV85_0494 [Salinibacterium amurskyense]|uniref:Uncharacterized protein n=1 Tax=Salinibacterium amurskyense TaxID=205941 RepID=A0A2M9D744_9MICO|nr:hypothetical protein [Salinibacterium amurskyense]PJJ81323.1 hypothetical protein CLV85_0494 [Salinibacterium amurskyense]RLQ83330.1 hypothetical protein D9C83_02450 [Salinibacterium amurskyense]GHD80911.1 hypothetical protein GCM10007394_13150 [Salinibacterium amurskyense]